MPRDYNFWIYIVTDQNDSVLYVGVINSFSRRIWYHRRDRSGFAADYRCTKLIMTNGIPTSDDAIARGSQLKKWSRQEGHAN